MPQKPMDQHVTFGAEKSTLIPQGTYRFLSKGPPTEVVLVE